MVKARQLYEEAVQDPLCLDNKLLYARFYAKPLDEEQLFRELLTDILEAPEDVDSDFRLENAAAKRTAAELLEQIDRFF